MVNNSEKVSFFVKMTFMQVKFPRQEIPMLAYELWQYGLWSFQMGYIKLERVLHKNQHTQSKLLNLENWTNGEPQQLAKIRGFKVDYFDFSCTYKT